MDTVIRIWMFVLVALLAAWIGYGITWLCLLPKPREYPAWCHNDKDNSLSAVCSTIKGRNWNA